MSKCTINKAGAHGALRDPWQDLGGKTQEAPAIERYLRPVNCPLWTDLYQERLGKKQIASLINTIKETFLL